MKPLKIKFFKIKLFFTGDLYHLKIKYKNIQDS
jgi:hypothetical protein